MTEALSGERILAKVLKNEKLLDKQQQGHVLLDRELSLPQAWTNDTERCARAGIPPERIFATKPQLARQMLERAFDARVPATWVAGDSVYGDHRPLRD